MVVQRINIVCKKCGKIVDSLWPLEGGICDECLVAHVTLERAIESTCPCLHDEIIRLFKKD